VQAGCGVESARVTAEQPPRARIADIIRDSGKMGGDQPAASQDQLAAIAAAISGASAGTLLASEALANELAKRFRLSTGATVERDLDAPYETTGRALILAMQACSYVLNAAFDTESGAIVEAKKPISLLSPAFTLTVTVADRGTSTHVNATAQHTGMDWGQNQKRLDELVTTTEQYLNRFKT
jgi:hypothetical protein